MTGCYDASQSPLRFPSALLGSWKSIFKHWRIFFLFLNQHHLDLCVCLSVDDLMGFSPHFYWNSILAPFVGSLKGLSSVLHKNGCLVFFFF